MLSSVFAPSRDSVTLTAFDRITDHGREEAACSVVLFNENITPSYIKVQKLLLEVKSIGVIIGIGINNSDTSPVFTWCQIHANFCSNHTPLWIGKDGDIDSSV